MWCSRGAWLCQTISRSMIQATRHRWHDTGSPAGRSSLLPCRFFTTGTVVCSGADGGRRWRKSVANKNFLLRVAALSGTGSALFGFYSWRNASYVVLAQDAMTNVEVLSNFKLALYQYQTCPFCCKVRAYLDYTGLPYEIVEVNPVFRQQIKFSKWRKVPILILEGHNQQQQLNDSSLIISLLSSLLLDQSKSLQELVTFYPAISYVNESGKKVEEVQNRYYLMYAEKSMSSNRSEEENEEERKWRMWVDNRLVHMLSPNVYRSPSEALQAFRWFSETGNWKKHFSFVERTVVIYVGAAAMYFVGKRLKKRHMLQDDVRQALYDVCEEWLTAVGTKRVFMGGDKPNLADLAVYGVLGSIEGCHAFNDVLKNTNIETWFYRMKTAVNSHSGSSLYRSPL